MPLKKFRGIVVYVLRWGSSGKNLVVEYIPLLTAYANDFLTESGKDHIAAHLRISFVLHKSLNVAGKTMTKTESYGWEKGAFIYTLTFLTSSNLVREWLIVLFRFVDKSVATVIWYFHKILF